MATIPLPASALRPDSWPDARAMRRLRLALLLVTLIVLGGWLAQARGGIDPWGRPLGTDFLAFWSAARLAAAGHAAGAYDLATIGAAEAAAVGGHPGLSSFLYPPSFLLLVRPLAALPYFAALPVWLALTGCAYLAALRGWLGRHRGWMLTVAAFPAVLVNVSHGQNGFLTAALMAGGLWLLDRRPLVAGLLLGAMAVKPQLAFAVPVLVIASGRWRVIAGGVASAAVLCLASLAAFGPGVWAAFLHGGAIGRGILERGFVPPGKMVSVFAAVRVLGGGAAAGYALQAIVAAGAAIGLALVCRRRQTAPGGQAALAAAATLLMSPFLLDYDLTLALVPIGWLFGEGVRRGFRPGERPALAAAFLLPLLSRELAMDWHLPLAPLVLGWLAVTVGRAAARP